MARMGMVVDLNRCVGCLACMVACKMENGVDIGSYWTRIIRMGPYGEFPNNEMYFLPVMCQHCQDPECVKVCPTGASYKRKDGIVLVDKDVCIGCGYCAMACPYDVRFKNEKKGVVEKCTLCAHRLAEGEDPLCVRNCAGKCRVVGDLDDPSSKVSKMLREAGPENLHKVPDIGNHPTTTYILRKIAWRSH